MKRLSLLGVLLFLVAVPVLAQSGDWIQLFNGKNLDGWKHVGPGSMIG